MLNSLEKLSATGEQLKKLPKWMRKAVQEQVLSLEEALLMRECAQSSDPTEELISLPEHLHEAASRVWLWELPSPSEYSH
jgi:hypothetical protein